VTEIETATVGTAAIERRLDLHATPERVWRALTESSEIASWFSERADLPAVPGREGWLEWDGYGRFAVRVEVAEPPHRLTWRWMNEANQPLDEASTLVEWTLEPSGDGGTTLRLRETGFRTPSSRTGNALGWLHELGELVGFLAVEPWEAGVRREYAFRASPERVWQAFADPAQFTAWWGGTDPVELRAGAVGWWVWPSEGGRFAVRIEAVEPPVYLAWCWSAEPEVALHDAAQVLRTEWAFQPRDDGGTNLLLLETGFRGPKDHDLNSGGWDGDVIPALRVVLGEPAPAADASAT
jgi:uncharacterized protein YndB with AHSA1/START domain